MKTISFLLFVLLGQLIILSSCRMESMFEQPDIHVIGYELKELPGELTHLEIDIEVINNDHREAHIAEVEYEVVIEGVVAKKEVVAIDMDILVDQPLVLTLPLTLVTSDAVQLLAKLDAGQALSYSVDGIFHVNDPVLKLFDLPLDIEGAAHVEVRIAELFEQPSVEVLGYSLNGQPDEKVSLNIEMLVTNRDVREVEIKDVEYQVYIEGLPSGLEKAEVNRKFTDGEPLAMKLPLTMDTKDAIKLLNKLAAGEELNYLATGIFHVNDSLFNTFNLPLEIAGKCTFDIGWEDLYQQPEIVVNGIDSEYWVSEITNYIFDFDVDCTVFNMDRKDVVIDEVEYSVQVEGRPSNTHLYSKTYDNDLEIAGREKKDLNLPVTLKLRLPQGAALVLSIANGPISYKIDGTMHIKEVEGVSVDFRLPLHMEGEVSPVLLLK